jgi:hypothetical protein
MLATHNAASGRDGSLSRERSAEPHLLRCLDDHAEYPEILSFQRTSGVRGGRQRLERDGHKRRRRALSRPKYRQRCPCYTMVGVKRRSGVAHRSVPLSRTGEFRKHGYSINVNATGETKNIREIHPRT